MGITKGDLADAGGSYCETKDDRKGRQESRMHSFHKANNVWFPCIIYKTKPLSIHERYAHGITICTGTAINRCCRYSQSKIIPFFPKKKTCPENKICYAMDMS